MSDSEKPQKNTIVSDIDSDSFSQSDDISSQKSVEEGENKLSNLEDVTSDIGSELSDLDNGAKTYYGWVINNVDEKNITVTKEEIQTSNKNDPLITEDDSGLGETISFDDFIKNYGKEHPVVKKFMSTQKNKEIKSQTLDVINSLEGEYSDDDSESDADDEEYYQKLDNDINSTMLIDKHPGVTQSSYSEILTLSNVVRNDKGVIIDELHKTYPFLSKYEKAKIIGVRTKQLNNGADPFIEVGPNVIDGLNIAIKELNEKKLPFIIARPLPNGSREYWRLKDLELIHY
jgi:DNA-directed RNA polymerase subunit K/omega